MNLLTNLQREQLLANGRSQRERIRADGEALDFEPVVKLFTSDAGGTWLLTELDPDDPEVAFGLCDLGLDCPELGYASLAELAATRGPLRLSIERDLHFEADKPLSGYLAESQRAGRTVT